METDTGREALLTAFDRLFDRAAAKLNLDYTVEERDKAKRAFAERHEAALRMVDEIRMPSIAEPALVGMESAIDDLSPAIVVAHLATIPLALHVQETMRQITLRAAEQRVLEHLIQGAEDRYGGN